MICPINHKDCIEDKCAWFVTKKNPIVRKCAVQLIGAMNSTINNVNVNVSQLKNVVNSMSSPLNKN